MLFQLSSFSTALFIWFSSHYVFNLEYHKYYKDAAMFMQEFLFDLPESDAKLKKQNYLTIVTELINFTSTTEHYPFIDANIHSIYMQAYYMYFDLMSILVNIVVSKIFCGTPLF